MNSKILRTKRLVQFEKQTLLIGQINARKLAAALNVMQQKISNLQARIEEQLCLSAPLYGSIGGRQAVIKYTDYLLAEKAELVRQRNEVEAEYSRNRQKLVAQKAKVEMLEKLLSKQIEAQRQQRNSRRNLELLDLVNNQRMDYQA